MSTTPRSLLERLWQRPLAVPTLSPREWETLLGQARQARMLGRVARHCAEHGGLDRVPEGPRRFLESALRVIDRQHQEVRWEVDRIRQALAGVETRLVLLKGSAYLLAGLPPGPGRLFSDIDILVDRPRLAEAEQALFRAGWISTERDAYNQRYYREWMHELPPMTHVQRGTFIDVHHTIAPPTSRYKIDGARLQTRPVLGLPGVSVLAPADMVLHNVVHLMTEGEFGHGLRDLLDLDDLLRCFALDSGFWPNLLARADELGLQVPLSHALRHAQRLFGTPVPPEVASSLRRAHSMALTHKAMSALLEVALRPEHPSCDTAYSGPCRWLLYVRSHYLRMPLWQVVPHLVRKAYMRRFPGNPKA